MVSHIHLRLRLQDVECLRDRFHHTHVVLQERHFGIGESGNIKLDAEVPELVSAVLDQSYESVRC